MNLIAATQTETTAPGRQRFDWLYSRALRRSGLRDVQAALRAGRLRWDDAELVAALQAMAGDSTLSDRERVRVLRCIAERERQRQAAERTARRSAFQNQQENPA